MQGENNKHFHAIDHNVRGVTENISGRTSTELSSNFLGDRVSVESSTSVKSTRLNVGFRIVLNWNKPCEILSKFEM